MTFIEKSKINHIRVQRHITDKTWYQAAGTSYFTRIFKSKGCFQVKIALTLTITIVVSNYIIIKLNSNQNLLNLGRSIVGFEKRNLKEKYHHNS